MGRRAAFATLGVALVAWLLWIALREGADRPPTHAADRPRSTTAATAAAPRVRARSEAEKAPPEPAVTDAARSAAVEGPVLAGRVVDAEGNAVEGARVVSMPDDLAKALDAAKAGSEATRTFTARSAADGRFAVRVDAASVGQILTATADAGFGQAVAAPRDGEVTVRLHRWTWLEGTVTDTSTAPIAGVTVTAHLLLDALREDRSAVTDAEGRYRIDRLPPTAWNSEAAPVGRARGLWVEAAKAGYAPLLVPRGQMGVAPAAVPTRCDLVLVAGMTVRGKVVDAETKAPIPGATVVCWSVEGMMSFGATGGKSLSNPWGPRPLVETRAGDDGTFLLAHLPAQGPSGVASNNAGARGMTMGHVAAWAAGYAYGGDEIPVSKDGATSDYVIELWPEACIAGRVVDGSGQPVAGATLMARVDDRRPNLNGFPQFWDEARRVVPTTGADGRYVLPAVRASRKGPTSVKLSAWLLGASPAMSDAVDVSVEAGVTAIAPDLVIDETASPRGVLVVRDESGVPVPGAIADMGMSSLRSGLDGRVVLASGGRPGAKTGPADRSLVVRARGFAPRLVTVALAPGVPPETVVVLSAGATVAGRVRSADGSPAAGASVLIADGAKPPDEALAYRYRGSMDQRGNAALVVYGDVRTDASGAFTASSLPGGPYTIVAETRSRAPVPWGGQPAMLRASLTGVAAGAADVMLTLPPDESPPTQPLEVVVVGTDGASAPTVVTAVADGVKFGARQVPDRPGRFRFDGLTPGTWTVQAACPGFARSYLAGVVISADAPPAAVELRLDRGVTLKGTVRADSGALPASTYVSLVPAESADVTSAGPIAEVAADGTYALTGLAPGRWRVVVANAGGRLRPSDSQSWVQSSGGAVEIGDDRREVRLDLDVVRAGILSVVTDDARLPEGLGVIGGAKSALAARSRWEIRDGAGAVVQSLRPVHSNFAPSCALLPGEYTVRLVIGDDPPQEQKVTVAAGQGATARFSVR